MVQLTRTNLNNFTTSFPQIERQFIGFNRVFDLLQREWEPVNSNFPVFNIKKLDDSKFELQLALAGFEEKYLDVTIEDGTLTITGNQEKSETEDEFVYKGIAARKFTRSWSLADTVVVKDATFKNGILTVSLENEIPEAKKPKSIQIKTGF